MGSASPSTTYYHRVLVRESLLDTFGHVNNAQYLKLFEEARWEMVTQNGYGLEVVKRTGLGPVILEANVRFRRELSLREWITIETRCTDYTRKVGVVEQRILKDDGRVAAEATFHFGLFDTHRRTLVKPTPEYLRGLGMLPAPEPAETSASSPCSEPPLLR